MRRALRLAGARAATPPAEPGRPVGADARQADRHPAFEAGKQDDRHPIRIGEERHGIPDAMVLGG